MFTHMKESVPNHTSALIWVDYFPKQTTLYSYEWIVSQTKPLCPKPTHTPHMSGLCPKPNHTILIWVDCVPNQTTLLIVSQTKAHYSYEWIVSQTKPMSGCPNHTITHMSPSWCHPNSFPQINNILLIWVKFGVTPYHPRKSTAFPLIWVHVGCHSIPVPQNTTGFLIIWSMMLLFRSVTFLW